MYLMPESKPPGNPDRTTSQTLVLIWSQTPYLGVVGIKNPMTIRQHHVCMSAERLNSNLTGGCG